MERAITAVSHPRSRLGRSNRFTTAQWRSFSNRYRGAPRIQIPAHVAAFSVLMLPALLFFAYYERSGDEDHLEQELRERYGSEIRDVSTKNKHMGEFFQRAIRNADGAVDAQLDEVLKAGRGGKKRMYAVDERLYGTAEGVAEKQRTEEELKAKKQRKPKKKPGEARTIDGSTEATSNRAIETSEVYAIPTSTTSKVSTTSPVSISPAVDLKAVLTVVLVASLAATVGFLAGGSRRT